MKKIITRMLFLILAIISILSGCSKDPIEGPKSITPSLTSSPATDKVVPIGCEDSISWETKDILSLTVSVNDSIVSTELKGSYKFDSVNVEKRVTFTGLDKNNESINPKMIRFMPQSIPLDKPTISLVATPNRLSSPGSVTITWTTTNADSVLHEGKLYAANGSVDHNVSDTTTFEFTAKGSGGQVSDNITVYVETVINPPLTYEDYICMGYWKYSNIVYCYPEDMTTWMSMPLWQCELDNTVKYYPNYLVTVDRHELLCSGENEQTYTVGWSIEGDILQPGNCTITILNSDTLQFTYQSFEILPDGISTRDIIVKETYLH